MKLALYFHTIRHLKAVQIAYRLPFFRKLAFRTGKEKLNPERAGNISGWIPSIPSFKMYSDENTFSFLNQSHTFKNEIEWDFQGKGLLWNYNLNYFEYLNQPDLDIATGYRFIDDFIRRYPELKRGREPYPISLRLISWIKFFLKEGKTPEKRYLNAIHEQAKKLQSKAEFHILANHLLENAFALYFSGIYLGDAHILHQGAKMLSGQLEEQILPDGGHYELSPMYHQLMLYRLLDVINISKASEIKSVKEALPLCTQKAEEMLGWMQQMCFSNGQFPLFNDAAHGIAPEPSEILSYAARLKITPRHTPLKESGYRKWENEKWEMFIKASGPHPAYQPGHSHSDALSFVLNVGGKPVLTDTGTSVYDDDPKIRIRERSVFSHNTVQIGRLEQSEIWASFRVARRANVKILEEKAHSIKIAHNGFYFKKKNTHIRRIAQLKDGILIHDEVFDPDNKRHSARFHFHPDIVIRKESTGNFHFGMGYMAFEGSRKVTRFTYEYAPYFGKRIKAEGLEIEFDKELSAKLIITG